MATYTYNAANQLVTSVDSTGTTTYTYSPDGNLTAVAEPTLAARTTMTYDEENRLIKHEYKTNQMIQPTVTTYTYAGDRMKRAEVASGTTTTLLWDRDEYVGEV